MTELILDGIKTIIDTKSLVIIVMCTLDWRMKTDVAVELEAIKVGYDFFSILKMFTTLVAISLSRVSACDRLESLGL